MRVFLSYHTPDEAAAKALREALRAREPGWDVFFAPYALRLGAFWLPKLGEAVAEADGFILLLGERPGQWQLLEYYEALDRKLQHQKAGKPDFPIVPVLTKGTVSGLPFLSQLHWIDAPVPTDAAAVAGVIDGLKSPAGERQSEPWRRLNPYRGLHTMREADADFFFGREALTTEIVERLRKREGKVLALIGNSGIGKSSVALAGVFGSLQRRRWPGGADKPWPKDLEASRAWLYLTVTPGTDPLENLAFAFVRQWMDPKSAATSREARAWAKNLADGQGIGDLLRAARSWYRDEQQITPPERFVLNVDQGEELYTRATAEQAGRFSELVAEAAAAGDVLAIASFRSDHYGQLQNDGALFPATERIDVPPLTEAQLLDIIRQPPKRLDVRFEDDALAPRMARAAAAQPGALPLLSYLLEDMWENMRARGDGTLRWSQQVIDVGGALVERAESFVESHADHTEVLKRLFCIRLAHVPREGEPVRRRARRSELSEAEWGLAQELAGPELRLLVTGESDDGEPEVAVAHEALIREWPTLRRWLQDEREFLVWKGQLEAARRQWEEAPPDQKDQALLMGLNLSVAQGWLATREKDLSEADTEFVRRSTGARYAERRARRIRHAVTGAIVLLALVASAGGVIALYQWQIALQQSAEAEMQRNLAVARAKEASRNESVYLAADALKHWDRGRLDDALSSVLKALPRDLSKPDRPIVKFAGYTLSTLKKESGLIRVLRGHTDGVFSVAFSHKGDLIVTASLDGTARFWDGKTGRALRVLKLHTQSINVAAVSPMGDRLVTASEEDEDKTARVWDTKTGRELQVLKGHRESVNTAAFSSTGDRIVTASDDKTARVWDAKTGRELQVLKGHENEVMSAAFSPKGNLIVTASADKTARVWDAKTGRELRKLNEHANEVLSAAFSRKGNLIVTASADKTARVWDAKTGRELRVLKGHIGAVSFALFSRNGDRIITASWDATARLWDARTGLELRVLKGHGAAVRSVGFSPAGDVIVTASRDKTVRVWDAKNGPSMRILKGHADTVNNVISIAFSTSGDRMVTASEEEKFARIWDVKTWRQLRVLKGHTDFVNGAAFSSANDRIVTASDDTTARVWDARTGRELRVLEGHSAPVNTAVFSPTGDLIVTASDDKTARLWDAKTGRELRVLEGHGAPVNTAVFSPTGDLIVTASWDGTARLWDAKTGLQVRVLKEHTAPVFSAAFNRTGDLIVTASADRSSRVWDAKTGRELQVLKGHNAWVRSAAFSPAGDLIVTASEDGTARLWDAERGLEMRVLNARRSGIVFGATFSPKGGLIVTASADGTNRLWDLGKVDQAQVDWGRRMLAPGVITKK